MSKEYNLPLSLNTLGKILHNTHEASTEIIGTIILPQKCKDLKESIRGVIFRNVFDVWEKDDGVVVGKDKLLCEVLLEDFKILEEAKTIQNKKVLMIQANIKIIADPGYTEEIKQEKKNRLK